MAINNLFVPYKEALALKELGYNDRELIAYYQEYTNNLENITTYNIEYISNINKGYCNSDLKNIGAPLYEQAFNWFKRTYGLYSCIIPKKSYPDNYVSGIEWYINICGGNGKEIGPDGIYNYNNAKLECLRKLIQLINEK